MMTYCCKILLNARLQTIAFSQIHKLTSHSEVRVDKSELDNIVVLANILAKVHDKSIVNETASLTLVV